MRKRSFYGKGIPYLETNDLSGCLVVIEGADGAGRSTQASLLKNWLGRLGYPTAEVGLKRSSLVGEELEEAMQSNTLGPRTLSLFYATDFADQLEHSIVPALRAGFVVLADRYIYTLIARDLVRGANPKWIQSVYGIAPIPDVIFYLKVPPKQLAERSFMKNGFLDYWESGMDIERSGDMYQCFVRYQGKLAREFESLSKQYGFKEVDGNRAPHLIHADMQASLEPLLAKRKIMAQRVSDPLGIQQPLLFEEAPKRETKSRRQPRKGTPRSVRSKKQPRA